MNVADIIRDLRARKEKLEQCIAALEDLQSAQGAPGGLPRAGRSGRKSMGEQERQEVSARMKRYWASRRKRRAENAKRR